MTIISNSAGFEIKKGAPAPWNVCYNRIKCKIKYKLKSCFTGGGDPSFETSLN
jgi:hypothetical protein